MRFDRASHVEQLVWDMRLSELTRAENRVILNNLYNGSPPYDESKAEENNIEINRNTLSGPNLLMQARRQWNQAFLTTENFFTVTLDSGPARKRSEWGRVITRHINRHLKESRKMIEQVRATGANAMLHGQAPCTWNSRRSVLPVPLGVPSVLVPSETDIDFDNCSYVAFFREWTPAQLYLMTHGPRVDKGWNMPLVKSQLRYVGEQVTKQPNATAYQYMPERIEELLKQDLGLWGSDATPTVDVWDFYFREADDDSKGWYRRVVLDWGVGEGADYKKGSSPPKHGNSDADGAFLYNSGKRRYANSLSEILHCQFADCSAVAPFKYHSIRSLGWMLWGVCDLENRMDCKFNEAVFQSLMWFFRTASNADMMRLKVANFTHMGVIPAGITSVSEDQRPKPDMGLVQLAFQRNRQKMNDSAASFTMDFDKGPGSKEMTATETMARINMVNAMVSGMLTLGYTYEDFKYKEMCRRICITDRPDAIAQKIQRGCLKEGVPQEMLDAERWIVHCERTLGAGNKTLGMAQAQVLQQLRPHLNPDAQREVDHITIEINTDDPSLAEKLAPLGGQQEISNSMHDAQLATERLMRGLPLVTRPDMVPEDYVKVWLADLGLMVTQAKQTGGMATMPQIQGFGNMAKHISAFLQQMAQDPEEGEKVRGYEEQLKNIMNEVKAFAQRLEQAMKARNGNGAAAPDPKQVVAAQLEAEKGRTKLSNMKESHTQRTAQRQVQFELEQQRKDRETNAEIRRENAKAAANIQRGIVGPFSE